MHVQINTNTNSYFSPLFTQRKVAYIILSLLTVVFISFYLTIYLEYASISIYSLFFFFSRWFNKFSIDTHLGCFQYFSIQISLQRNFVRVCACVHICLHIEISLSKGKSFFFSFFLLVQMSWLEWKILGSSLFLQLSLSSDYFALYRTGLSQRPILCNF